MRFTAVRFSLGPGQYNSHGQSIRAKDSPVCTGAICHEEYPCVRIASEGLQYWLSFGNVRIAVNAREGYPTSLQVHLDNVQRCRPGRKDDTFVTLAFINFAFLQRAYLRLDSRPVSTSCISLSIFDENPPGTNSGSLDGVLTFEPRRA